MKVTYDADERTVMVQDNDGHSTTVAMGRWVQLVDSLRYDSSYRAAVDCLTLESLTEQVVEDAKAEAKELLEETR